MPAPRMRIGVVGAGDIGIAVAQQCERAGHSITLNIPASEIANVDMVIISVPDSDIPDLVTLIADRVRPRQIVLHCAAEFGVGVLEQLENRGVVGLAMHPLSAVHDPQNSWVVTTSGELGSTVAELLLADLGGTRYDVPESDRANLGTALAYVEFAGALQTEAQSLVHSDSASLALFHAFRFVSPVRPGAVSRGDTAALTRFEGTLDDEALTSRFRDFAKRTAEIVGAEDVELWAMSSEGRA